MNKIYLIFSLLFSQISAQELKAELYGDKQKWTIEHLNGQRSFNDGPNCYNAALTAKGYSDFLLYSDPIEFQYYLINYCHQNEGHPKPLDILVAQKYFTKHAGVYLRDGFIYEKRNNEGSNNRRSRFSDTTYRMNELTRSSQFNMCAQDGACKIVPYTCLDARSVRNLNRSCVLSSSQIGLIDAQTYLQRYTMDPNKNLSREEEFKPILSSLIDKLKTINQGDPCDMYYFVTSSSILGYLELLNYDRSEYWNQQINNLKSTLNSFRLKISERYKNDEKYKKLLEESLWLSRPVRYE